MDFDCVVKQRSLNLLSKEEIKSRSESFGNILQEKLVQLPDEDVQVEMSQLSDSWPADELPAKGVIKDKYIKILAKKTTLFI